MSLWESILCWLGTHESVAIWLEGVALLAIFIWDRIDSRQQHEETLAQLNVSQKQVDALIKSERAWVIASPVNYSPQIGYAAFPDPQVSDIGKDTMNIFGAAFKNTGDTPARITHSKVVYRYASNRKEIPAEPDYGERNPTVDLLLVKQDSTVTLVYLQPNPLLNKLQYIAVQQGEGFLYAYGIVEYEDVFEKKRETRFGYLYRVPLGGDPLPASFMREGLPAAYNRAT
jgi:hypothetical protein